MTTKLTTEIGKSYWDNSGAYQEQNDKLYEQLVPAKGEANTVHGEMIRCINRLFYEFCNNGNCNAINVETETETERCTCSNCNGSGEVEVEDDENETCEECGGSGEYEEDGEEVEVDRNISPYYERMVDFLEEKMTNKEPVKKLREFLLDKNKGYSRYEFNEAEMKVYNNLCDEVIYQVLTTENEGREVTDSE